MGPEGEIPAHITLTGGLSQVLAPWSEEYTTSLTFCQRHWTVLEASGLKEPFSTVILPFGASYNMIAWANDLFSYEGIAVMLKVLVSAATEKDWFMGLESQNSSVCI